MSRQCREFAANLLDECRTSDEVQLLLKQDHTADYGVTPGGQYPRLRLAINYAQKEVKKTMISVSSAGAILGVSERIYLYMRWQCGIYAANEGRKPSSNEWAIFMLFIFFKLNN